MLLSNAPLFLGIESTRAVVQALATGVVTGSGYALLGVGFALILSVTGRFHFAYGLSYACAGFFAAVAVNAWGVPFISACLIGLLIGTCLGVAIERLIYQPLVVKAGNDALLAVFVAALGIVIVGENLLRLVWGSDPQPLAGFPDETYSVGNVNVALVELAMIIVAAVLIGALSLTLNRTLLGQQIKAVRGNPEMATVVGINVQRLVLLVFTIGSLIAGIAGIFEATRFTATADMGNTAMFYAFVVAFVAGVRRSPIAIGVVGLAIGVLESMSTLWLSDYLSALSVFGLLALWLTVGAMPQVMRALSGSLARSPRPVVLPRSNIHDASEAGQEPATSGKS